MNAKNLLDQEQKKQEVLNPYQAYGLFEKELNILLLLEAYLALNPDIKNDLKLQEMLEEADLSNRKRKTVELLQEAKQPDKAKKREIKYLIQVLECLQQTDEAFSKLDPTLLEKINPHRQGIKTASNKEASLKQALDTLVLNKSVVVPGAFVDSSYVSYASSGNSGSGQGGVTMPSFPESDKLTEAAKILLSMHVVLGAQIIYGFILIVGFMRSEWLHAKQLQKGLIESGSKELGIAMRLRKNALIVGLFVLRTLILGGSIALTVLALTNPAATAALLFASLSTYLFEEFRHLHVEKKTFLIMSQDKIKLYHEIEQLDRKVIHKTDNPTEYLEIINQLEQKRRHLAEKEYGLAILKDKIAKSMERRNKTLYSTISAALIIASIAFPPLFGIGLSMLLVPLAAGLVRCADEKWNKAKISSWLANTRLAKWISNAFLYKKMYGLPSVVVAAEAEVEMQLLKKEGESSEPLETKVTDNDSSNNKILRFSGAYTSLHSNNSRKREAFNQEPQTKTTDQNKTDENQDPSGKPSKNS